MKLIVRAADYAMTDSITDGCLKAIRDGILTDVGLMTNDLEHAKRAIEEVKKYSHVSIGMDLNIVSGKPASDPKDIPSLVDENGILLSSTYRKKNNKFDIPYNEIYWEMKNQIERFIELVGKKPSYITGHSIGTPDVLKATAELKKEYGVKYDCFSLDDLPTGERWYYKNMVVSAKDVKPDYSLDAQKNTNVTEHIVTGQCKFDFSKEYGLLATHCGYCDGELLNMSTFSVIRGREVEALCSPEIKKWVKDNDITLINFDQYVESHK